MINFNMSSTMLLSLLFNFLLVASSSFFLRTQSSVDDFPTANLSTTWPNNSSLEHAVTFQDGTSVRAVLLRGSPGLDSVLPTFACGFFCSAPCDAYLFAIFIVKVNSGSVIIPPTLPQVVWSANRNKPVRENATLEFSGDGNLILRDPLGAIVWSTDTAGRSVVGMNLTETGNILLYDDKNATVWDSFDHPTDSLLLGQTLRDGQRLTANVSATNSTSGQLFLSTVPGGLEGFVDADPPQTYFGQKIDEVDPKMIASTNVTFSNGGLNILALLTNQSQLNLTISLPRTSSSMQYVRLESDGHLRIYQWGIEDLAVPGQVTDVLAYENNFVIDDCDYPTVCGEYGFCSSGQCSCLNSTYFRQVDQRQGYHGCTPVTPLTCQSTEHHSLLHLDAIPHFIYGVSGVGHVQRDEESCKQACLKNCSCKAAFFISGINSFYDGCHLQSQVFPMRNNTDKYGRHYNSTAYIKVQDLVSVPNAPGSTDLRKKTIGVTVVIGITISALLIVSLIIGFFIVLARRRKSQKFEEDDQLDQLGGLPKRFSYEELTFATENFCQKLGGGGFGSVFKGTLSDGVCIAVKRLDRIGQGRKEFLAEVKNMGNIHHINLVRLIGFCSEKAHRLLVYEYMGNGSLDKWIFFKNQDVSLDWQTRYNIITDVAKGLSYLHEGCQQRIAHLDIKPENILLDDKLQAKLSDFGLSKLIDREQSHVLTAMRGTRGYLAPEWLTSKITEKADVFSFGVVIMEIVCGRKNLDLSQPEEYIHLVSLLQDKVQDNSLFDIADKSNDIQLHENEVIEMMRLAMWCLQNDSAKRPKMSTVVKVLEGSMNVETDIEYNFTAFTPQAGQNAINLSPSAPPSAWLLSGSR